jgi:hypothetical protein
MPTQVTDGSNADKPIDPAIVDKIRLELAIRREVERQSEKAPRRTSQNL